jgi:ADP-ribose pyrophosphatase YjhB (NUDIX family)
MTTARFFYRDPTAPTPNRPPSLGVLALIEYDGALLLERRSDCGRWGLIGGAVDAGESLTDALRREVHEETGLTVTGYRLFGTFSDPTRIAAYPDGNVFRVIGIVYTVEVAISTICASATNRSTCASSRTTNS